MAYLYTKGGDKGTTGLFGGSRVSKASLRVDCYGTVDETNSMLGVAYSLCGREAIKGSIRSIQERLFSLAAEIASDAAGAEKLENRIGEVDVTFLEQLVDNCTAVTGKLNAFIIPGKNQLSATLHVARTIIRRAERGIIQLNEEEPLRPVLLQYVNRLSDALFALALLEEHLAEEDELREAVTKLVQEKMEAFEMSQSGFNLEKVMRMAGRAEEKANEMGVPVVFAAVDAGANLQLLHRMEGALLGSVDIATNKAYTACALKMATHELCEVAQPGGPLYGIHTSNDGRIVIFGGGYPLKVGDEVVGAIGVSGGSVEEDMTIASYALGQGY